MWVTAHRAVVKSVLLEGAWAVTRKLPLSAVTSPLSLVSSFPKTCILLKITEPVRLNVGRGVLENHLYLSVSLSSSSSASLVSRAHPLSLRAISCLQQMQASHMPGNYTCSIQGNKWDSPPPPSAAGLLPAFFF